MKRTRREFIKKVPALSAGAIIGTKLFSGPVTINYEYGLGGAESESKTTTMSVKEISDLMRTDLN